MKMPRGAKKKEKKYKATTSIQAEKLFFANNRHLYCFFLFFPEIK
jgi:hypothetical protein